MTTLIDLLSAFCLKHKLSTTFIEGAQLKRKTMKTISVLRSTEYDWLKKEEDELEQWKQKKRKGFYKMARKLTSSASSLLQLQIE